MSLFSNKSEDKGGNRGCLQSCFSGAGRRVSHKKQTVTKIISNLSRIVMRRDNADFIFQHKEKTFLDNVMTFFK